MFTGEYYTLLLFIDTYVTVVFLKLSVQRNEFNSCHRMELYKN